MLSFHIKYIHGNIYMMSMLAGLSDCAATILAGFIQKAFNTKRTCILSFMICIVCSLPLLLFPEVAWVPPISIFGAKFGLAIGFNMMYHINTEVFPTLFVSFAFSIGNLCARTATILAPEVAELAPPKPMLSFVLSMFAAIIVIFLLRIPDSDEKEHVKK